jgi:hypothetical protein
VPVKRIGPIALAAAFAIGVASPAHSGAAHRVRVPDVEQAPTPQAYGRLHTAGLRVTLPGLTIYSLGCAEYVVGQSPAPGRTVGAGAAVRLRLSAARCGVGSPAVSDPLPSAVVPNFVGRPVSQAYAWAQAHQLYWQARLGPVHAGAAALFYANYVVRRQSPAPGTTLRQGVRVGANGFRPTPLSVAGVQG